MKINKIKLLVGTMAIAAVAATVGSISGTVAWFQYSTRSTVAYQGAQAHCSENLQVRLYQPAVPGVDNSDPVDGDYDDPGDVAPIAAVSTDWKQDLLISDIRTFLTSVRGATAVNKLTPVTSGALAANKTAETLYRNPIYQYAATNSWGTADKSDYVELPLQFRVLDVDGDTTELTYLAKKLYITDITLAAVSGKADITTALRVSIKTANFEQTFSSSGTAVPVGGNLDLNNDHQIDQTEGYEWTTTRTNVKYGDYEGDTPKTAASQAIGTKATGNSDLKVANDANAFTIIGKELITTSTFSGTSAAADAKTDWAGVTVRIYLEGWTPLTSIQSEAAVNATPTLVWDAVKALTADNAPQFNVGMRFTAEAHNNGAE